MTTPRITPTVLATAALCVLVGATGCADKFLRDVDVDVELEGYEREYVLEAYVRAGDTARVFLDETYPVNEEAGPRAVPAATVVLTVDGEAVGDFRAVRARAARGDYGWYGDLDEDADSLTYYEAFLPTEALPAGAHVRIEVTLEGGTVLTAEDRMPAPLGEVTLATRRGQYDETQLTIGFRDLPGRQGYLLTGTHTAPEVAYFYDEDTRESGYRPTGDTLTETLTFETGGELDYFYHGRRYTTSDELFDGGDVTLLVGAYSNLTWRNYGAEDDDDPGVAELEVAAMSLAGREYLWSLALADWNAGNPFVEPVVVPSNVEGGIGALILVGEGRRVAFEME